MEGTLDEKLKVIFDLDLFLSKYSFVVLRKVFWIWSIHAANDGVISFIGFESDLLSWPKLLFFKFLYFMGEHFFRSGCRVDAVRFYRDDKMASVLYIHGCVDAENSGLIWLSNICENDIAHANDHSVFLRMSGIFNNGNYVRSLFRHIDKISSASLGEFHSVNCSFWTD